MKVIALVDPLSGGHHSSFMRHFAKILIELGYKVIVLHQNTQDYLVPWISKESNPEMLISKDFTLKQENIKYLGRFNEALNVLNYWRQIDKILKGVAHQYRLKIDLVFFAWLDAFLANYLHPWLIGRFFPYRWTGLYFHPRHLRLDPNMEKRTGVSEIDIVLSAANCIGVAIHDRGIKDILAKRIPGKKVVMFAETADDSIPMKDHWLAEQIKANARGRTVVGMIGLTKQQGIDTFIKLSQKASTDRFFFLFAGRFNAKGMTKPRLMEWNRFVESHPENCLFHLEPIPEGEEYNAVFCAIDIPFLVYQNFTSTSNRLTKASIFRKPVISTNRFCIGEDVARFHLGITVPEDNVEACLEAIERIRTEELDHGFKKEDFEKYAQLNSYEQLVKGFKTLLDYQ